ncbi:MAG: glutathione S-transferase family protein [Gammaproteobacteria bacterium]
MSITLYGSAPTRSTRVAWMLEEIGLEYDLVAAFDPRSEEFGALNPNRKVPVLVDGDFVVWESMAVNLYLAQRYGGSLWPRSLEDQTRASMWSFWVMTELEDRLLTSMRARFGPEAARDADLARKLESEAERPLGALELSLTGRDHLLGEAFTVADLNVASVLTLSSYAGWDLAKYENVSRWLGGCLDRPSMEKVRQLPMSPPPPSD